MPRIPPIDTRTREDLFKEMQESLQDKGLRIEAGDGEILTALTVIYSNMLEDTIKRLNKTPEKHRAAFLNMTHTPPRPAWQSSGIVVFEVVAGYDNTVDIKKGTRVAADINGQPVSFQLRSDLTAAPANITDIYWCDPAAGRYGYSTEITGLTPWKEESTQENAYKADFKFKNILCNNVRAALFIEAELPAGPVPLDSLLRITRWSVSPWPDGGGDNVVVPEDRLIVSKHSGGWLCLEAEKPVADAEYIRIHIEITDSSYAELTIKSMYLMQLSGSAPPDTVITSSRGLEAAAFHPFGVPMRAFEECGIFCDCALSQRSSEITVRFGLRLERSEEEPPRRQEPVDYKWIMRKPLPKPTPVIYEAFAKSVRLEYWDGSTYREIRDKNGYVLDFTHEDPRVKMTFDCPENIAASEYYGRAGYYLRLSCAECDELYSLPRYVYTPHITEFRFYYKHTEKYYPVTAVSESFGSKNEAVFSEQGHILPFNPYKNGKTLLLGFDRLAWKCRMQIYINIENNQNNRRPRKAAPGANTHSEFCENVLMASDFTGGLTANGFLSVDIPENAKPAVLFGKERYWVALTASDEAFPQISGIYINAAAAENKIRYEESFPYSGLKNNRLTLAHKNIIRATVYVRALTGIEMNKWREYTARAGNFREGFYKIDYISGLITFPDDIVSRSVNDDVLDLIRVIYFVTDGDKANVPANSITRMEEAIPFIQSVRNPMRIVNGEKGESGEELASRKRHEMFNGGRIVSKRDFELFTLDNCPFVSDVKCVYNRELQTVQLKVRIKKDVQNTAFTRVKRKLLRLFKGLTPGGMCLDILPWDA